MLLAGVFGVLRVATAAQQADNLDAAERDHVFAQRVAAVVHELQRERELTAGIIVSDDPGRAELDAQILRVDEQIRLLDAAANDLRPDTASSYRFARSQWDRLVGLREDTLTSADPEADTITVDYTELVAAALDVERLALLDADARLLRRAASVATLANAKESVALQHANLLVAIETENVSSAQAATLRDVAAAFEAGIAQFTALGSAQQVALYADTVTGPAVADREQLEESALASAAADTELDIDPQEWSAASRATVDLIRQVEIVLLDQLRADSDALAGQGWRAAMRDLAVAGAVLALVLVLSVIILARSRRREKTARSGRAAGVQLPPAQAARIDSDPAAPVEQNAGAGAGSPKRAGPDLELPMRVVVVDAPGGKAKAPSPSDPYPSYGYRQAGVDRRQADVDRHVGSDPQAGVDRQAGSGRQAGHRTIEDEWIEWVGLPSPGEPGARGSQWRAAPPGRTNIQAGREQLGEAGGPLEPAPPGEGAMDIRAGVPAAADEPIFADLVSAWFQERRSDPDVPATAPVNAPDDTATPPAGLPAGSGAAMAGPRPDAAGMATEPFAVPTDADRWESAADQGWQAAQSLRDPITSGLTAAGLPKRQPRAQLVPGAPGVNRLATPGNRGPVRSAETVRGRLSSYQRGLYEARHASREWDDPPHAQDAWGGPVGEQTE
ncbi:MAG TPA: nitrate- and nitrite sensing domain-containing protein [Pseudonocardiaceae bacterium]|nr:nitrate- and nitrite sensing domain-containing protein [Pseudonocardiaceae bacterium]